MKKTTTIIVFIVILSLLGCTQSQTSPGEEIKTVVQPADTAIPSPMPTPTELPPIFPIQAEGWRDYPIRNLCLTYSFFLGWNVTDPSQERIVKYDLTKETKEILDSYNIRVSDNPDACDAVLTVSLKNNQSGCYSAIDLDGMVSLTAEELPPIIFPDLHQYTKEGYGKACDGEIMQENTLTTYRFAYFRMLFNPLSSLFGEAILTQEYSSDSTWRRQLLTKYPPEISAADVQEAKSQAVVQLVKIGSTDAAMPLLRQELLNGNIDILSDVQLGFWAADIVPILEVYLRDHYTTEEMDFEVKFNFLDIIPALGQIGSGAASAKAILTDLLSDERFVSPASLALVSIGETSDEFKESLRDILRDPTIDRLTKVDPAIALEAIDPDDYDASGLLMQVLYSPQCSGYDADGVCIEGDRFYAIYAIADDYAPHFPEKAKGLLFKAAEDRSMSDRAVAALTDAGLLSSEDISTLLDVNTRGYVGYDTMLEALLQADPHNPQVIKYIIDVLEKDYASGHYVLDSYVRALLEIGPAATDAIPVLLTIIGDYTADNDVERSTEEKLGDITSAIGRIAPGDPTALDGLKRAWNQGKPESRIAALKGFAAMGTGAKSVVSMLLDEYPDLDNDVQFEIINALIQITGVSYGNNLEGWIKWYGSNS
jgi:HEAT repeat protein